MSQRFKILVKPEVGSTSTPEILIAFVGILSDMVDRGVVPRVGETISSEWFDVDFKIAKVNYIYHSEHDKQLASPKIVFTLKNTNYATSI